MSAEGQERSYSHAIDLIIDSVTRTRFETNETTGKLEAVKEVDDLSLRYKTQLVASREFGSLAHEAENLRRLANQATYYMMPERAELVKEELMEIYQNIHYAIDAKSSETMTDRENSKPTLLHMFTNKKQEKVYHLKGVAKRTIMDGIIGKANDEESET